jgi:hypothetical protein
MKLHIKYSRDFNLCFASTTLENGQAINAAGHSWEEAKANLIDKVRVETGFFASIPAEEEIEIEGKVAEETGSLFGKEADKQFEHPAFNPQDFQLKIPAPEQTQIENQTQTQIETQTESETQTNEPERTETEQVS